jgi:CubicO group peptidase (beta-lactamase class C family)
MRGVAVIVRFHDVARHARAVGLAVSVLAVSACSERSESTPPLVDRLELADLSRDIDGGAYGAVAAIVVSQGGQILFEDYFGGAGPDRVVDMRSTGKSLTALAVGIALDDDLLPGLDMSVLSAFEDRAPFAHDGPGKRAITLEDLLGMSSALDCNDWDPRSPGNEEHMYRTGDWTGFVLDLPILSAHRGDEIRRDRFSYCTAGVFLLGQVVERSAGQRIDAFMEDRLFAPLGVGDVAWRRSPSGEVQSGGQLGLTARDAERLGRLVLQEGVWEGEQIVSSAWIAQMLTPRTTPAPGFRYGLLWWLTDLADTPRTPPVQAAMMVGNGGNLVVVLPSLDAVAVVQARNYNRPGHFEMSMAIVREVLVPALQKRGATRLP